MNQFQLDLRRLQLGRGVGEGCLGLKVGTGVPICLQTLTHPYTKKTQKVTHVYTNLCGSTFVFLTLYRNNNTRAIVHNYLKQLPKFINLEYMVNLTKLSARLPFSENLPTYGASDELLQIPYYELRYQQGNKFNF